MTEDLGPSKHELAALRRIAELDDPTALRVLLQNAREKKSSLVYDAAFRRLAALVPDEVPGTIEHDFWKTTLAYEQLLTEKHGRSTRDARIRQKVARAGVRRTIEDLALARNASDGFKLLLDRGMPELTAEAVILMHRHLFSDAAVEAAQARLEKAQIDISKFARNQGVPNG